MCKTKKTISDVFDPKSSNSTFPTTPNRRRSNHRYSSNLSTSSTNCTTATSSSYNFNDSSSSSGSSISCRTSLSTLRHSLPDRGHIYDYSEICSATNNFLRKRHSSSSSSVSWRCNLRGHDVIVFQRKFRRRPIDSSEELREKLSLICKSHYTSLIKLRGASISGNYVYLVYDFVPGANLADCLRNPRNPNFTVLSNWMSRIQIATDVAHGLDYIHNSTGLSFSFVHNHIKSTSIIVTEPSLNARICHFGTAELCGEIEETSNSKNYTRSDSRLLKVEGTRGYMSPELQSVGVPTRRSDVYALGIVILELLSGEEPLKYRFEDEGGWYVRVSLTQSAREAVVEGGGVGLRRWVDRRLKDSYPVEVAEKLARVGLECVEEDPEKRPGMDSVAGRVSKLYLESQIWAEKMGVSADFTVSLAPR